MIAAIEDGIVERIKAASTGGVLGYALKEVKTYGGELDEDGLREVVKRYPAVWVVWAGSRFTEKARGLWWEDATFAVIVATKSLRNEQARRHGAPGEVGSYQIVKDVKALLGGNALGLDIQPLQPTAGRSLFQGVKDKQPLSLYAVDFLARFITEQPETAGLDDFATFHADWDLPPFAPKPEDPLPLPPGQADAEDLVAGLDQ